MDHHRAEQKTAILGPLEHTGTAGRPSVWTNPEFVNGWPLTAARIRSKELTITQAARQLGVSRATIRRILGS